MPHVCPIACPQELFATTGIILSSFAEHSKQVVSTHPHKRKIQWDTMGSSCDPQKDNFWAPDHRKDTF
jgi:hypothetical protein